MNSTKRGDALETKIYKLLQEEISQDRFYVKKECCEIFCKKGYYSKDREKNIIFDISIEIYLPGQDSLSILVLVECKNYNHPVPVDDSEEFFSKIQQISGANVKGIIASTNSFQEGTVKFAKSKGIGLLRYYDNVDFKWVLTRSPSSLLSKSYALSQWLTVYRGIADESYYSKYFDCYCCIGEQYTNSLNLFFVNLVKTNNGEGVGGSLTLIENVTEQSRGVVAFREESEIEELCGRVLETINYDGGNVQVEEVCKWQTTESGLRLILDDSQKYGDVTGGILGRIIFEPIEITIFKNAHKNDAQQKFTLAHELGHLLLGHGKYMLSEYCQEPDLDFESPIDLGIKDIMRMEWQANYFASCLLLPREQFIKDFLRLITKYEIIDRGFGLLYLDEQKSNISNYYKVTDEFIKKYEVSRRVIKIRLKRLGLLKETDFSLTSALYTEKRCEAIKVLA